MKYLLLPFIVIQFAVAKKGYLLTGPKILLKGSSEKFCLHLHEVHSTGTALLELLHPDSDEALVSKSLRLEGEYGGCISLTLKIPRDTKLFNGRLNLKVDWDNPGETLVVKAVKEVRFQLASPVIQLIQTDKAWYTPGQLVRFRTLALDHMLEPVLSKVRRIWVTDPSNIVVAEWNNVTSSHGLKQLEFQLSPEPVQGIWSVNVLLGKQKSKQQFEVKEFVLPRFEVTIENPTALHMNMQEFSFDVCAKYTYGQPVAGQAEAIVQLDKQHSTWYSSSSHLEKVEPVILLGKLNKITGCSKFSVEGARLGFNFEWVRWRTLQVEAHVTEKGTDIKLNTTWNSRPQQRRVKLDFHELTPKIYQVGLPYYGKITIMSADQKPLIGQSVEVCAEERLAPVESHPPAPSIDPLEAAGQFVPSDMEFERVVRRSVPHMRRGPHFNRGNQLNSGAKYCAVLTSDDKGVVSFSLLPTNNHALQYQIKASYDEARENTHLTIHSLYSPSQSFMLLPLIETTPVACNTKLTVKLYFTAEADVSLPLHWLVMARGDIVATGVKHHVFKEEDNVDVPLPGLLGERKSQASGEEGDARLVGDVDLELDITSSFSPKASLLVYYVREDGEMVTSQAVITVAPCFPNPVTLQWNSKRKYPGEAATLSVHTGPNSLCGLSVVDQSVTLAKPEWQLTEQTVLDKLPEYNIGPFEWPRQTTPDDEHCRKHADDKSSRAKRSFRPWGAWYFSHYKDAVEAFDNAGLLVMTDFTIESRPCQKDNPPIGRSPMLKWRMRGVVDDLSPFQASPLGAVPDVLHSVPIAMANYDRVGIVRKGVEALPYTSDDLGPTVELRTYFPETWLWDLYHADAHGKVKIEETLPHTITSWVGRAICVSESQGFGISSEAKIEAFQPFFMELNLPYSMKRGEKLKFKITVMNYMNSALPVRVQIVHSDEFELISELDAESSCIDAKDSAHIEFVIRPTALGQVNISVQGIIDNNYPQPCGLETLPAAKDALIKSLVVEPEGFPVEKSFSHLVCPQDFEEDKTLNWDLSLPSELVEGSARAWISIVGDLMGPALEGLSSLVRMPTGCGEQNMVTFTPLIYVTQYLDAAKLLDDKLRKEAVSYMQSGYQRELTYRHSDGSYSAFGESDSSGSLWLTAFVVKSFAGARSFIHVDKDDISKSVKWITSKQLENGCFRMIGTVLHKELKGGLGGGESLSGLTAFTVISLLESQWEIKQSVVKDAKLCMKGESNKNLYTHALVTYALSLAKDEEARSYLDDLLGKARQNNSLLWWEESGSGLALSVEMTSYALLSLLQFQTPSDMLHARNVVRWLSQQRNSQGGFSSTQDTVVGLQALAAYAMSINSTDIRMDLVLVGDSLEQSVHVSEADKLVQRQVRIPVLPTKLEIDAVGQGCVVLQATMRYNVHTTPKVEAFSLTVESKPIGEDIPCAVRRLKLCTKYLLPGSSNMALLELNLVSGYAVDKKGLQTLQAAHTGIKRIDEKDNKVVFYFDSLDERGQCITLSVWPAFEVNDAVPANIKVSDYYQSEQSISQSYSLPAGCALSGLPAIVEEPIAVETFITNVEVEAVEPLITAVVVNREGWREDGKKDEQSDQGGMVDLDVELAVPEGVEGVPPVWVSINGSKVPPPANEEVLEMLCPVCLEAQPDNFAELFCETESAYRAEVRGLNKLKLNLDLSPSMKTPKKMNLFVTAQLQDICKCPILSKNGTFVFVMGLSKSSLNIERRLQIPFGSEVTIFSVPSSRYQPHAVRLSSSSCQHKKRKQEVEFDDGQVPADP